MTKQLRPYQLDAIQAIYDYFNRASGHPLIEMPTGTGKSLTMAGFVRRAVTDYRGIRVLILTHVKELILQDFGALINLWPGAPAGIYSASVGKRDIGAQILFAGIASIYRKAYNLQRVDLVLIDEAHLLAKGDTGMYRVLLDQLTQINPDLKVIGFTATPYRFDSGLLTEGEGALFTDVAYTVPLLEMIDQGYLCPVVPKPTAADIDMRGVRTQGGEFAAVETEHRVADVVERAVLEIVRRGQECASWLVFTSGIENALRVRDLIREQGETCETVTGDTPSGERDSHIATFKAGRIRCLTNANVLTTGFDCPGIDLIADLAPTKSKGRHVQKLGRGTRPVYARGFDLDTQDGRLAAIAAGAKPRGCLVLDFAGNARRHGPLDMIDGRKKPSEGGEAPTKECPECEAIVFAGCRVCAPCGYEFPEPETQIEEQAATDALLSTQIRPEWVEVDDVSYDRWIKPDKPPSMRVTYRAGMTWHREWICLDHPKGSFPRVKAEQWWRRRATLGDVPATVDEALPIVGKLPAPAAILIRPSGKFTEIVGHRF